MSIRSVIAASLFCLSAFTAVAEDGGQLVATLGCGEQVLHHLDRLRQLMIEFFVVWVIVSVAPEDAMAEFPETTVPPVGLAKIGAV